MITDFKLFEEVHERSVSNNANLDKNDYPEDKDYVILDNHYFNYKRSGDDIIIGRVYMPHVESYTSKYIKFDDSSYNGYYSISKIMYWAESKEELLAFLAAQKFNI